MSSPRWHFPAFGLAALLLASSPARAATEADAIIQANKDYQSIGSRLMSDVREKMGRILPCTYQRGLAREQAIQQFRDDIAQNKDSYGTHILYVAAGAPADSFAGLVPLARVGDYGFFALAGAPAEIVQDFEEGFKKVEADPKIFSYFPNGFRPAFGSAADLAAMVNRPPAPGSAAAVPAGTSGGVSGSSGSQYYDFVRGLDRTIIDALGKAVAIAAANGDDPSPAIAQFRAERQHFPEPDRIIIILCLPAGTPHTVYGDLVPVARVADHGFFVTSQTPPALLRDLERVMRVALGTSASLERAKAAKIDPTVGGPAEVSQLFAATPEKSLPAPRTAPTPRVPASSPYPNLSVDAEHPHDSIAMHQGRDEPRGRDLLPSGPQGSNRSASEGPAGTSIHTLQAPKKGISVDWGEGNSAQQAANKKRQALAQQQVTEKEKASRLKQQAVLAKLRQAQSPRLSEGALLLQHQRDQQAADHAAHDAHIKSEARRSDAVSGSIAAKNGYLCALLRNNTDIYLNVTYSYGGNIGGQDAGGSWMASLSPHEVYYDRLPGLDPPSGGWTMSVTSLVWVDNSVNYGGGPTVPHGD